MAGSLVSAVLPVLHQLLGVDSQHADGLDAAVGSSRKASGGPAVLEAAAGCGGATDKHSGCDYFLHAGGAGRVDVPEVAVVGVCAVMCLLYTSLLIFSLPSFANDAS